MVQVKILFPSCWNSKDGRINVNVTGGSGSLVLGWKPLNIYGVTSISGLGIGKYTLCVTDSLGCVAMSDFDFFQSEITSTVDVIKDATCAGSDGVAVIKSTGGNPSPVSGYASQLEIRCADMIVYPLGLILS